MFKNIIILIIAFTINSFAQDWSKVIAPEIIQNGFGYSLNDLSQTMDIDANDNIYLAGHFNGRIIFGTDTLISNGLNDIFVVKYDASDNVVWATSAGGDKADYAFDLVVDPNGGCFITGYYSETMHFNNINVSSNGNSDIYVAKIDDLGNWSWVRSAGGSGYDRGAGITIDNSRNVIITGRFEKTADFGSTQLTSTGSRDVFIAKLDHLGNWNWAKKGGSSSTDEGVAVVCDASNNIYATGFFRNTCLFFNKQVVSAGSNDIFVVKLNPSGDFLWAEEAGGTGTEQVTDLIIDSNGDFYITGSFENDFILGGVELESTGNSDILVAKFDAAGDFLWSLSEGGSSFDQGIALAENGNSIVLTGIYQTKININNTDYFAVGSLDLFTTEITSAPAFANFKVAGSNQYDAPYGIAVNSLGEIYTCGFTYGDIDFGAYNVKTRGNSDGFLVKQYSNYSWAWAKNIAAILDYVEINDIVIDGDKNKYITGFYYGTIKLGATNLTSQGESDIFVAKMDADDNFLWAVSAGGDFSDEAAAIDIDGNGNVYVAGSFFSQASFGGFNATAKLLTDAFVAQLDNDGNWQWIKNAGGLFDDKASGIAVDNNGDVLFTGFFYDKIFFGNTRVDGEGFDDIFVAKLDNLGNWIWYKNAGGSNFDYSNGIETDDSGNAYLFGSFESNSEFDAITVNSEGNDDGFVAKMNTSGDFQWVTTMGGDSWFDRVHGLKFLSNNKIYACGSFSNLAKFGAFQIPSHGDPDAFIGEIDGSGNWVWVNSFGDNGYDVGYDIDFDSDGKMYFTGVFSETVAFGNENKTAAGLRDVFLTQMDQAGNVEWVSTAGGNYDENAHSVAVAGPGISYVAGSYNGNATFDINMLNNRSFLDRNGFLAKNEYRPLPDWQFTANTGRSTTVIVPDTITPQFNGMNISEGDAIGAFYKRNGKLECAGYSIYENNEMQITVWGDDYGTADKDGFTEGEKYQFKIWDSLTELEYLVGVRFADGPKVFTNQTTSMIGSMPAVWDSLSIDISQGWNLFSSYCDPDEPNMEIVFEGSKSKILIIKNGNGKIYVPQFNINTIGDFNIEEGYQLYAPTAFDLKIPGVFVEPEDVTLTLKTGWNLISYLRDNEISAVDAFAPIVAKVLIVKNGSGKIYVPQFNINTIGNLKPTEGYQIYLTAPANLTYPAN